MLKRVTHGHLMKACEDYNKFHGFKYGDCGHLQWVDVFGSGIYRPRLMVKLGESWGLSVSRMQGATMRETLHNIQDAM